MKPNLISLIILLFLLFLINSKMSEEKRKYLLNKYAKKINLEKGDVADELKKKYYSKNLKDTINYDPAVIESIIEQYEFPNSYNYLEENNITAIVKDQAYCGCCWSHAATSALGYRYHKKGIEVNLSPQDALSCYLRDCDAGNYLIDAQMNLVKNGTLTEGCLPFSSADGITIEPCPTTCKDGSEFKRYYSQNAYITEDYLDEDSYYDIVALIMDQLLTNGPVVTGIEVYEDFMNWHYDSEKCKNDVYTYDGESEMLGGHAIVIVGYGFLNSKYYWLVQNSWGEDVCDHGFLKIEFGQIGVEAVAFSEPYIHKEIDNPKNIRVDLESFDEFCDMVVSTTSSLEDWQNTLDLGFKNSRTNKPFNYQCSSVNTAQGKVNKCYFEYYNYFTDKGTYSLDYFKSLGEENTFNLTRALRQKEFDFYGYDDIYGIFAYDLFVSQEGSKMMLFFDLWGEDNTPPPIYANENSLVPLSNCQYTGIGGNDLIVCDIKQSEVDYFQSFEEGDDSPMFYDIFCGYKYYVFAWAYKLDTTKYPVFKIKKIIFPEKQVLTEETEFTLIADIEGSISGYYDEVNYFYGFVDIEIEGVNYTALIDCYIYLPDKVMKNYEIYGYVYVDTDVDIPFDNVYLYPYNIPFEGYYPFEVYIKDMIKGQAYNPRTSIPKIQVYIESLCPDCVNFITKSFKDFYENVKNPNLAEIEFIPYGNAKEEYNETTGRYDFTCQHKENECYGNIIETCAIQIMGRVKSYGTILCIESNIQKFGLDFDTTLEYCLTNEGSTVLKEIKECVNSDLGNYYEHQMAQKTSSDHKYVPWVVVNGVHDVDAENQIIESLVDYLCGDDKTKCYLD